MSRNNFYKKTLALLIITLFLGTTSIPAYTSRSEMAPSNSKKVEPNSAVSAFNPEATSFIQSLNTGGTLIGPFSFAKVHANFLSCSGWVYKLHLGGFLAFELGPYGDGYLTLRPLRYLMGDPINVSSDRTGKIGHRIMLQTKHFFGKVKYVDDRTILDGWCIVVQILIDNLVLLPDITLTPTDDSYVNKLDPNQNYGAAEVLEVGDSSGTETARSYLKFDLPDIPSSSIIHYALLTSYYCDWEGTSEPDVGVYSVNDGWNEENITWNNQPNISSICEYPNNLPPGGEPLQIYWDITDLAQDWIHNDIPNKGVVLKFCNPCQDNITQRIFRSKESTIENERPTLMISYNSPPYLPARPHGETYVKIGKEYNYTTWAKDPDDDRIYYWFDWGDGTNSGWVGPCVSNVETSVSHSWKEEGSYQVKAKVKDTWGLESDWSDPKNVYASAV